MLNLQREMLLTLVYSSIYLFFFILSYLYSFCYIIIKRILGYLKKKPHSLHMFEIALKLLI